MIVEKNSKNKLENEVELESESKLSEIEFSQSSKGKNKQRGELKKRNSKNRISADSPVQSCDSSPALATSSDPSPVSSLDSSLETSTSAISPLQKSEAKFMPAGYPQSKVIHHSLVASPLSSESPSQNYRGLLNLSLCILFVTNFRLVLENLLKYGLLVRPLSLIPDDYHNWPCLTTTLYLNVHVVVSWLIEKEAAKGGLSEKLILILHSLNVTAVLAIPIIVVEVSDSETGPGTSLLMIAVILFMKLISYFATNADHREARAKKNPIIEKDIHGVPNPVVYPHNLTLSNIYYFWFAPTLCYQLNYPRTDRIRRFWLFKRVCELFFCLGLQIFMVEQYILPLVRNSVEPLETMAWGRLAERILKLSVPNLYIWLLGFYGFFQVWLNILAELLYFADRNFYGPWWNSLSLDEYWRIWNIPTHNWLVRHLYFPLVRAGMPKEMANISVFFFSAVMHELLVSIPVHTLRLWAFAGMMWNVPLIWLTKNYGKKSQLGNVLFWVTFCILGQPLCVLLYYHDYYIRWKLKNL